MLGEGQVVEEGAVAEEAAAEAEAGAGPEAGGLEVEAADAGGEVGVVGEEGAQVAGVAGDGDGGVDEGDGEGAQDGAGVGEALEAAEGAGSAGCDVANDVEEEFAGEGEERHCCEVSGGGAGLLLVIYSRTGRCVGTQLGAGLWGARGGTRTESQMVGHVFIQRRLHPTAT